MHEFSNWQCAYSFVPCSPLWWPVTSRTECNSQEAYAQTRTRTGCSQTAPSMLHFSGDESCVIHELRLGKERGKQCHRLPRARRPAQSPQAPSAIPRALLQGKNDTRFGSDNVRPSWLSAREPILPTLVLYALL